jgi:hypothetical protein
MENSRYHTLIKPEKGTKLKYRKEEKAPSNTLPASIGHIFKSPDEIKEEVEFKSFRDFITKRDSLT